MMDHGIRESFSVYVDEVSLEFVDAMDCFAVGEHRASSRCLLPPLSGGIEVLEWNAPRINLFMARLTRIGLAMKREPLLEGQIIRFNTCFLKLWNVGRGRWWWKRLDLRWLERQRRSSE